MDATGANRPAPYHGPVSGLSDRRWDTAWSAGYAAGLDDLQAKVEEWFCNVSLDDLRTVEFADVKA